MGEKPDLRVLNLGAGVQSSALFLMACHGEFEKPDVAIFADTGDEAHHTYAWVWQLAQIGAEAGIRVEVVRAAADKVGASLRLSEAATAKTRDPSARYVSLPTFIAGDDGSVGMSRRVCTGIFKADPIHYRIKEMLGFDRHKPLLSPVPLAEQWIGMSRDEPERIKDSRVRWLTKRYPLALELGMTRWDCELWLMGHGYDVPKKSACVFCPYHDDRTWRDMRDNDPESWEQACQFDEDIRDGYIREGPDKQRGKLYVHRQCVPLREVDLSTEADRGQLDLFGQECEGMCGV